MEKILNLKNIKIISIQKNFTSQPIKSTSSITSHSKNQYKYFQKIETRWSDNDQYGHVNNSIYYFFFDTVVNNYLIKEVGINLQTSNEIAVVAETGCKYVSSISYPESVTAGLRIKKLGKSSVIYEVGIFKEDESQPSAFGFFVHVFISRDSRNPVAIPETLKAKLEKLIYQEKPEV